MSNVDIQNQLIHDPKVIMFFDLSLRRGDS